MTPRKHFGQQTRQEQKAAVVSVSPDLIMSRHDTYATALKVPSGAELTWMAMLEAEELPA